MQTIQSYITDYVNNPFNYIINNQITMTTFEFGVMEHAYCIIKICIHIITIADTETNTKHIPKLCCHAVSVSICCIILMVDQKTRISDYSHM